MGSGSLLHHISFGVRDLELSGAFYDAALGALGFRRVFEEGPLGVALVGKNAYRGSLPEPSSSSLEEKLGSSESMPVAYLSS